MAISIEEKVTGRRGDSAARHALAVLLNEGHEALWRAALKEERVLKEIRGTSTLHWVSGKHAIQEVF